MPELYECGFSVPSATARNTKLPSSWVEAICNTLIVFAYLSPLQPSYVVPEWEW